MPENNPYIDLFRRYVAPQWRRTALLAALILASIGLQLLGPQLLRAFIDNAIGGAAIESLSVIALAFVVVNVLGNLVLLVGVLAVVAREDLRAGLALTIFAAVALFLMAGPLRNIAVKYWGRVREVSAQMYGFLGERLAGTEDIRSSGAEAHVMSGLAWHHRAWLKSRSAAIYASAVLWSLPPLIFAVCSA